MTPYNMTTKEQLSNMSFKDMWRELRWMWRYVRRYRISVAIYFLLGVISVFMALGTSLASKYLIDAVTHRDTAQLPIAEAAVLMGGTMLLNVLFSALYSRISARIHVKVRNEIRAELFSNILRADWEPLQQFRSGDLLNRINVDADSVASAAVTLIPNILISFLQCAGGVILMLTYDPIMALISLISVPLSVLLSRTLVSRMRYYNRRIKQIDSDILSYNEDTFRNMQTVKAFDIEGQFTEHLEDMQGVSYDMYLSYNRIAVFTSMGMSLIGVVSYAACFGWGAYRLFQGTITYGTMTLFLTLFSTIKGSFSSLVGSIPTAISAATSAGRMMELSELPAQKEAIGENDGRRFRLHIENVNFSYQRGDHQVLRDVSLSIEPGEVVAVVGPSGEGKTTLVRLILDLVNPSSGEIWLQDADTGERADVSVRRVCSYVPQGNTLFAGTVAENMRMVQEDATDEEVIEALKNAGAWKFIQPMPNGINSEVGEHGGGFSEGQAQRISIARALLKKAPILFLDEATSALDAESERYVLEHLRDPERKRLTIIITHRPGALALCDKVFRISDGKLEQISVKE